MTTQQFSENLSKNISDALNNNVPINVVVSCLDDAAFQLKMQRFQIQQAMLAKEMANKIVPANGAALPKLPPRN